MERLKCKACGCYSMIPLDLNADEDDEMDLSEGEVPDFDEEQESRFFTCHVCGDNWLSVKRTEAGACEITFIHQMGMQPTLKRTAMMEAEIGLSDAADDWEYYLGDDEIEEAEWRRHLASRRWLLKAICTN
jgi:hypothetical protein